MRLARTRPLLVLALLGLPALALPSSAQPLPEGASRVVAGPQAAATSYLTTEAVTTTGSVVSFTNLDTTPHDVVSRETKIVVVKGKKKKVPVFAAKVTSLGQTAPAAGTETLKPGTYDFYCSLHGGMEGTLTVR